MQMEIHKKGNKMASNLLITKHFLPPSYSFFFNIWLHHILRNMMTAFGGGRRRAFGHSLEAVAAADIRQGRPGHVGRIVANMHNLLVHHHSSHRSAEEKGIFWGFLWILAI
jgi:hypothetical protein